MTCGVFVAVFLASDAMVAVALTFGVGVWVAGNLVFVTVFSIDSLAGAIDSPRAPCDWQPGSSKIAVVKIHSRRGRRRRPKIGCFGDICWEDMRHRLGEAQIFAHVLARIITS